MKYYAPRFLFRRFEVLRRVEEGARFLEIGPGNLYLSKDLLAYFEQGTLVEFDPQVQETYDALDSDVKERMQLLIADFLTLELGHTDYDCVVACEVLEHIVEEEAFLRTAVELLRPEGQLILSVPARRKYWSIHDEIVGHVRRYEQGELLALLRALPLNDIEVVGYGFPFANFFRLLRVGLAWLTKEKRRRLGQAERTKASSRASVGVLTRPASVLVNPYTFYPLNLVSSSLSTAATRFDLATGYLVFATKSC
jgi:SAM-dependent methyltransferase